MLARVKWLQRSVFRASSLSRLAYPSLSVGQDLGYYRRTFTA